MGEASSYSSFSKGNFGDKRASKPDDTRVVLCPGDSPNNIDNYVLIPLDGIGFIVIKQVIVIDTKGKN